MVVLANNCYSNYGATNARELVAELASLCGACSCNISGADKNRIRKVLSLNADVEMWRDPDICRLGRCAVGTTESRQAILRRLNLWH